MASPLQPFLATLVDETRCALEAVTIQRAAAVQAVGNLEKQVQGLQTEKRELLAENAQLKSHIELLKQEMAELRLSTNRQLQAAAGLLKAAEDVVIEEQTKLSNASASSSVQHLSTGAGDSPKDSSSHSLPILTQDRLIGVLERLEKSVALLASDKTAPFAAPGRGQPPQPAAAAAASAPRTPDFWRTVQKPKAAEETTSESGCFDQDARGASSHTMGLQTQQENSTTRGETSAELLGQLIKDVHLEQMKLTRPGPKLDEDGARD